MVGITNITTSNISNIIDLGNVTTVPEFMAKANWTIYNGWYFFIMLWVLWIILFFAAMKDKDAYISNMFYTGIIVSLVSIFLRLIEIADKGIVKGLLTDFQMWIFPLICIMLGTVIWMTKDSQ